MTFHADDALPCEIDSLLARAPDDGQLVISTGHGDLDKHLHGGLRAGHLTLVCGETGAGSSTFALGIARHAAMVQGLPAVFCSPTSSHREIVTRIIAAETRVPASHLRSRDLTDDEREELAVARDRLATAPLLATAAWSHPWSITALKGGVETWAKGAARLIVLDDVISASHNARELVESLRQLAHAHRVSMIVVSSMGPLAGHRAPPRLCDLGDLVGLTDLFDLVLTLHRDDLHDARSLRPGEADITIAKHRYGPTRVSTVAFQGHYARFVDMCS